MNAELDAKYNGVEVQQTWSLIAFAQQFGTPKLATCVNKETGKEFKSVAFDKEGTLTFAHFGYSTEGMTAREIAAQKDNLRVGLNSNGKYTLFKQENGWETINLL